MKLSE